jgi:hypothetical protein
MASDVIESPSPFRSLKAKPVSAPAVSRALAMQKVEGVAGPLRFAANHFAITQWYAWEVFDDSSGSTYLVPLKPTLHEYIDPHSTRCKVD